MLEIKMYSFPESMRLASKPAAQAHTPARKPTAMFMKRTDAQLHKNMYTETKTTETNQIDGAHYKHPRVLAGTCANAFPGTNFQ